jgi:hypothetical protein
MVLGQPAKSHLGVAKLALDYPKRVFNLGSNLSLEPFDESLRLVQQTSLFSGLTSLDTSIRRAKRRCLSAESDSRT